MKKVLTFILLMIILSSASLIAQNFVSVVLKQPPPFKFVVEDLWKVTLTNTGQPQNVYLFGTVSKRGQILLDAKTATFNLPAGVKNVNAREVSPVDLNKYSDEVDKTVSHNGSLPSGIYTICVYAVSASNNQQLGSYCGDYEIINATKAELLSPQNTEAVLDVFPMFNWLPPAPIPQTKTISYELRIVEILERQSAFYSMSANPLWFSQKNINTTLFKYPAAARQFKIGSRYAWQVLTFVNGYLLGESEIWEFKCENISQNIKEANNNFYINYSKDTSNKKLTLDDLKLLRENRDDLISNVNSGFTIADNVIKKSILTDKFTSGGNVDNLKDSWFKFNGSYKIEYSHSDKIPVGSELPQNVGSLRLDPSISIYNIPFSLNLYFDTQQDNLKQNINSFALLLKPSLITDYIKENAVNNVKSKVSNWLKFFSFFKTLSLGETYPSYSKYTLNGVKATGVDVEFYPGVFYLAFSTLKNLDAIPDLTFRRDLFAGRIGVGEKEGSHFHFTALKVYDKENSINLLNSSASPQENVVLGTSAKLKPFGEYFEIGGEFNAAMMTRDVTAPEIIIKDYPEFLRNFINPRISSSYDFMYDIGLKVNINEIGTKFEAGFKSVGPGYTSLGAPNIRQDINSLQFGLTQNIFKKRIILKATLSRDINNASGWNSSTTTYLKMGYNLRLNFPDYPFLVIDFRPNSMKNDAGIDTLKLDYNANVFSLMTGYNIFNESYTNSVNFLFSSQSSSSLTPGNDYSIYNYFISNSLAFVKIPLTLGVSLGYTRNSSFNPSNSFTGDFSLGYSFFDVWSNSLGVNYSSEIDRNSKTGLYFISTAPVSKYIDFNFYLEKSFYKETLFQYGDINDLIIRISLSKSW